MSRLAAGGRRSGQGSSTFYLNSAISTEDLRNRSARAFLICRFFRVVVPAWVAMLLLALIKPPYLETLVLSVFFIPLQNNHPPTYGYSFLIVAWTLTYEIIFYLIFAGALCFRLGRRFRGWISGGMVVV